MDVKGRLEQVSLHLRSIHVFSGVYGMNEFEYQLYFNAFNTPMWRCKAYYDSPLGSIYLEVNITLDDRWSRILLYNDHHCFYKHDIDTSENT